jgi:hypothetical protein
MCPKTGTPVPLQLLPPWYGSVQSVDSKKNGIWVEFGADDGSRLARRIVWGTKTRSSGRSLIFADKTAE